MNKAVKTIGKFLMLLIVVPSVESLLLSLIVNQEGYDLADIFGEYLVLCFAFYLLSIFFYLILLKVVFRSTPLFAKALVTGLLTAAGYYALSATAYAGIQMKFKFFVILLTLFTGGFLLPILDKHIFPRTQNVK